MLIGHTFRQDFESVCICGVESERDGKRVARRQDPQASLCAGEVPSQVRWPQLMVKASAKAEIPKIPQGFKASQNTVKTESAAGVERFQASAC